MSDPNPDESARLADRQAKLDAIHAAHSAWVGRWSDKVEVPDDAPDDASLHHVDLFAPPEATDEFMAEVAAILGDEAPSVERSTDQQPPRLPEDVKARVYGPPPG